MNGVWKAKLLQGLSLLGLLAALALPGAAHAADPRVRLSTSMGDIVLELNAELAPKSTANFLHYVKTGYYKGTIFHRVIQTFMIQGGGYDKRLRPKQPGAPIVNESKNGLKNEKYTIAMARSGDPHSATSQFFINVEDNPPLDYPGRDGWGYAVFGKVVEGMDVVDKIRDVEVEPRGEHRHVPVQPVTILKAVVLK